MLEFLEDFEKRMEWIGIVDSVVNRRGRDMELESLFQGNAFVNVIFSTLLYIMEKTLSEDSDCDIGNIAELLEELLPQYYNLKLEKSMYIRMANYIIKNVLQNSGAPYDFNAMNYEKGLEVDIRIRLIEDRLVEVSGTRKVIYNLTKQGYEFLFRTKEVDEEIQLTMEELKLKELIKRKNFKKAQEQSYNLINMVRQKKNEINIFMTKIRENIHNVDINEYERLLQSTFELLNDEYDLLNDIMKMAISSEKNIRLEYDRSNGLDDKIIKAQNEIRQINENIKVTLNEQKELILSRQSLSQLYIEYVSNSFTYSFENRYDFDEKVLLMMEKHIEAVEGFWKLVNPLFLPDINRNLNIRSIYERQGILKNNEDKPDNVIEPEELQEDTERKRIEKYNEIYIGIMDTLINFTIDQGMKTTLSEYLNNLDKDMLENFTYDRLVFTTMLKLYDIGTIDVKAWLKSEETVLINPSEEFSIEYCLYKLIESNENIESVRQIKIYKESSSEELKFEFLLGKEDDDLFKHNIAISNFTIEVIMSGR
jgi:hypothetical protein